MITKKAMIAQILKAMNQLADVEIDPKEGRKKMAEAIGNAVEAFVIGRTTKVATTGTAAAQKGQGIIQ